MYGPVVDNYQVVLLYFESQWERSDRIVNLVRQTKSSAADRRVGGSLSLPLGAGGVVDRERSKRRSGGCWQPCDHSGSNQGLKRAFSQASQVVLQKNSGVQKAAEVAGGSCNGGEFLYSGLVETPEPRWKVHRKAPRCWRSLTAARLCLESGE